VAANFRAILLGFCAKVFENGRLNSKKFQNSFFAAAAAAAAGTHA